ncbi:MAG: tetratricopeptide repeat protein [Acidobacteriota bacterium]
MPLNAAESLQAGLAEHRAGNLAAAALHYCKTLESAPSNADALHLLGLLLSEQGEHGRAMALLSRAVELSPNLVYVANLGLALRRAGDLQGAIAAYREALKLNPSHSGTLGKLGCALIEAGEHTEAESVLLLAVMGDQRNPELCNALGHARASQQRFAEARLDFERALALDPGYEEAAANLAQALLHLGHAEAMKPDWDAARAYYEAASRHAASLAAAWYHRGLAATALQHPDEARDCYQRAISLDFNYAEAHNNLGHLLQAAGDTKAAIRAYELALAIRPGYVDAQYNLAITLQNSGRVSDAEQQYENLLIREAGHADARNNLGGIRLGQNRVVEAIAEFELALQNKPTHIDARWNLGLAHLGLGDFARGWPLYETRLEQPTFPRRDFDCPRWTGQPLTGRTLYVWAEQGLGDTIQFVRYLPLLTGAGARVILEVQPRLTPLLERFPGIVVRARGSEPVRADFHIPLLSLPGCFDVIPPPWFPVEIAPADLGGGNRKKVGLCWAGHPDHTKGRHRSISLKQLAPLAELPGFEFFSLQRGPQASETGTLTGSWRPLQVETEDGGIAELASIVAGLDLIITVDTMVAHMAGTAGKPVWTLLPFAADWRWMLDREDSPWYPSIRLFRQTTPGDWAFVVERVRDRLATHG